jgi:RND family efflux transporter MFP subunit
VGWPDAVAGQRDLVRAARSAQAQSDVVVDEQPPSAASPVAHTHLAVPFAGPSGQLGAVAVEIADCKASESGVAIDQLRFGVTWLQALARGEATKERVVTVLELVASGLEQTGFCAAATAIATELATRLACERVSIGFERGGQMRVEALSHSATFDERASLIRDLGSAMDEASDQDTTIVHPPPPGSAPRIVLAHEGLAERQGAVSVCTVPTASSGRIVGGLTFERTRGEAFDAETVQLCEDASALLGPVLELKRALDARPVEKARQFLRVQASKLFGPDHPSVKLIAAGLAACLLFLGVAKGDYRVRANATLEGKVQRAIVAALDGYIAEADARAGDLVQRGQVLGRLDDRDLVLERRKWLGRREELWTQYREALAAHERAEVNVLSAKLAQADAQLELLDEELVRTRLIAPFDGIIVKGDLSQSLGSPVEKGAVLFELAPLEGYRIILKVDERDISDVEPGQTGRLALSAMPGQALSLTVERVTPVATAEDGSNFFRAEGRLDRPVASLRPGMEGIAKIEIDRRRLLWIWTHPLLDWIRLRAWSWWL